MIMDSEEFVQALRSVFDKVSRAEPPSEFMKDEWARFQIAYDMAIAKTPELTPEAFAAVWPLLREQIVRRQAYEAARAAGARVAVLPLRMNRAAKRSQLRRQKKN